MPSVDEFFSKLNPHLRFLLGAPILHWPFSSALALITITGRRSGRRYTIPVGYQRSGDLVVILASEARRKQWWRNYEEPAAMQIRLRGRIYEGVASSIAPSDERFLRHCEHALRRMPALGRAFGIRFDADRGLTNEQLRRLEEDVAVVEVAL